MLHELINGLCGQRVSSEQSVGVSRGTHSIVRFNIYTRNYHVVYHPIILHTTKDIIYWNIDLSQARGRGVTKCDNELIYLRSFVMTSAVINSELTLYSAPHGLLLI